MSEQLKKDRWPSFIVGALLGLLSVLSFVFARKLLGASSFFVHVSALFWGFISPQHLQENIYYQKVLKGTAFIDWQFALIVGVFLGSYFAGNFFHKSPVVHVPRIWRERFGASRFKRYLGAFIGGMILLAAARLAGGCTSGNGLSGSMQLAITGWAFMIGLFAVGVPTAFILYRNNKRGD